MLSGYQSGQLVSIAFVLAEGIRSPDDFRGGGRLAVLNILYVYVGPLRAGTYRTYVYSQITPITNL